MEAYKAVKEVFKQYIPDDKEIDEFALWAFGEEYMNIDEAIKFLECWNYHHSKELLLKPDGQISADAPEMVKLWRARK